MDPLTQTLARVAILAATYLSMPGQAITRGRLAAICSPVRPAMIQETYASSAIVRGQVSRLAHTLEAGAQFLKTLSRAVTVEAA